MIYGALASAKKGAEEEGRTIVWVDESGFYLLPALVRTYAPLGETPILRVRLSRDHVSAIIGITMDGSLLLMAQERAYCTGECRWLSQASAQAHPWAAAGNLGWLAHPSWGANQDVPGQRGR